MRYTVRRVNTGKGVNEESRRGPFRRNDMDNEPDPLGVSLNGNWGVDGHYRP